MGYELWIGDQERFKSDYPKFLCIFCAMVLQDPMQTPCAHLYCRNCLVYLTVDKRKTKCRCLADGSEFDIKEAFPDGCIKQEILLLKIHCPNWESGCRWEEELKALDEHLKTCEYVKIFCVHTNCSQMVIKKFLVEHLEKYCPDRTVKCDFCRMETTFFNLKQHKKDCPSLPVKCTLCGQEGIKRSLLSKHHDPITGECEKSLAVCPFFAMGCPEKKEMDLKERRSHEQRETAHHLNLFFKAFTLFKNQTLGNIDCLETIKISVSDLTSQVIYITQSNEIAVKQLEGITARTVRLEENFGACGGFKHSDIQFLKQQVQEQANQLQECDRKFVNFEAKTENYEFLLGEATKTIEEQRQENLHLKRKLEETSQEVRRLSVERGYQGDQSVARPTIVSWDEMPSTDGTLMWKITNYTQRRQEAISGRNTSFYSPAFYSSRHGYKMCARIYLNGDGMGRESHISLFFVLMRGEYDALLRWPFRQKITMMILDQDNVEHAIDAFRPDPNSSSFQRPRREMNIASGCPLFCPLSEMDKHAYVRDDVMFVKIIVDCSYI